MQIIVNGLIIVFIYEFLDFIINYVKQELVECIIIGLFKQMNNEVFENMKNIEFFVCLLKKCLFDMFVEYVDECFIFVFVYCMMFEVGLKKKDR